MDNENYICKKEIDWSTLTSGITLPYEHQVNFHKNMEGFTHRGDVKVIKVYMEGREHQIKLYNVNNSLDKCKNDCYQLRYSIGNSFAVHLRELFNLSYNYFVNERNLRPKGNRKLILLPEDKKEYIAIYTTEYPDTFIVEPIFADDILAMQDIVKKKDERTIESALEKDDNAGIIETQRTVRLRKLNKKIGDNLKLLYGYRCQICGKLVGEEFGCSKVVESHHIEYFTKSLNNNASNQIIVCPNHHTIIHEVNPVFDRRKKLYLFKNGVEQMLMLNKHL